jgi:hypothetical protein
MLEHTPVLIAVILFLTGATGILQHMLGPDRRVLRLELPRVLIIKQILFGACFAFGLMGLVATFIRWLG